MNNVMIRSPRLALLAGLAAILGCGGDRPTATAPTTAGDGAASAPAATPTRRPNILLIIADDLGYSDIGTFGGEIRTPALDALAAEGRVLLDHHAGATCSPTRSMLFSGTDHHLVGLGTMAELIQPEQVGKPGYEGYLNARAFSIAELLRDAGYHTLMAGKWHLGLEEDQSPKARGFEASFALLGGAASHFAPRPDRPVPSDDVKYREDGKLTAVPEGFFSSDFYADRLIAYIDRARGDGRPFFAYAAFTAPHWPLQAPDAWLARTRGRYDEGYSVIRERRLARQKQLGVIPVDFQPNAGLAGTAASPTWDQLTPDQRRTEARKMEIYAAMVENLDWNVGRVIDHLKQVGAYDDTFVFFQSDNGAEGSATGFPDGPNTDNAFDNLGRPLSNVTYGPRWAEVSATPFRLWKAYSTEGGVSVPAIARLPRGQARAKLAGLTHVSDLLPTFLELAGVASPGTRYQGRPVYPITGVSLVPALHDAPGAAAVRGPGAVLVDELFGRRYVRRDQWKLVWVEPPLGRGDWELFDLATDRAEAHDVADAHPVVVRDLRAQWDAYVDRVGVVLPKTPGIPGR